MVLGNQRRRRFCWKRICWSKIRQPTASFRGTVKELGLWCGRRRSSQEIFCRRCSSIATSPALSGNSIPMCVYVHMPFKFMKLIFFYLSQITNPCILGFTKIDYEISHNKYFLHLTWSYICMYICMYVCIYFLLSLFFFLLFIHL